MTTTDDRLAKMNLRPSSGVPRPGKRGLPPGPSSPALVQSLRLMRFRHTFVPRLKERYGDVFALRLVPEGRPLVLFDRASATKEIFASDPEVFHAGKGNAVLGPIMGE